MSVHLPERKAWEVLAKDCDYTAMLFGANEGYSSLAACRTGLCFRVTQLYAQKRITDNIRARMNERIERVAKRRLREGGSDPHCDDYAWPRTAVGYRERAEWCRRMSRRRLR